MTIALMTITSIYFLFAGWQDLKERKIYSFPFLVLFILWTVRIALGMIAPWYLYLCYAIGCLAFYMLFQKKKIWGAGDNDLFLLFAVISLSCSNEIFTWEFFVSEVIHFALALIVALLIGLIESRIKKRRLDKTSSIAVAPGFAVVMLMLMWKGVIGC